MTISGKSMNLYDLKKKLTVTRQKSFIFNQIHKLIKKLFAFTIYKHEVLSESSNTDAS